jgi:hypothetical protein
MTDTTPSDAQIEQQYTDANLQRIAKALRDFRPDPDYLRHLLAQPDCPEKMRVMAEHYLALD